MSDLHDISWYYQMHRYQGNLLVDQAYVYFISDRGGNFAIWRKLRRGGAPEAVTHLDASYSVQAMAADFSHGLLYFLADRLGRETCAVSLAPDLRSTGDVAGGRVRAPRNARVLPFAGPAKLSA